MKNIKRYCDKCKKETNTYMKILIVNSDHSVIKSRSYDKCEECILKEFPEFNNEKRAGLQRIGT